MSDAIPNTDLDSPRKLLRPSREYRNYDGYRSHPYAFGYVFGYTDTVDDRYDEVISRRGTNNMSADEASSPRDDSTQKRSWLVNIVVDFTLKICRCLAGPS